MKWKYQPELKNIPHCPPNSYQEINTSAFRWVFADMNDNRNFRPPLIIEPTRINKGKLKTPEKICEAYALSLYDTEEHARNSYLALPKRMRKIAETLGTHLAKVVIQENDGVVNDWKDEYGHFNLHEYENTNLQPKFNWIGPI